MSVETQSSICLKNERTNVTVSSDSSTFNLSTISPNLNQTAGLGGNLNNSVALQTDSAAVNVNSCTNKVVLLQTVKACFCNLNKTKKSTLRMLFDSGSQRTFLNENVKELLNLKSISKYIRELGWMSHGVMCFWFLLNFLFISVSFNILASLSISRRVFSSDLPDRWTSSF